MTRPEWEIVREWDGFDQTAYAEALKEFKSSFDDERKKRKEQRLKMIQQNNDCGCWVEPDETYKTLIELSKVLLPDAKLSISKTIEQIANEKRKKLNGKIKETKRT